MFRLKTALFIIFIFAACSENKEQQKAGEVSNIVVASPTTIQANINTTLSSENEPTIQLENTYCFGGCHIYKLSIYPDGKVIFEGVEGVKRLGVVKSRIAKSKLNELIRKFKDVDFFQFSDRYITGYNCLGTTVTDADTFQIYYNDGKLSKNISHYRGCRDTEPTNKLFMLEESVEKATNIKQWSDW